MDWAVRSLWLSHSLAMPTKQIGLSATILGALETFLNRRTVAVNRGSWWAQQADRRVAQLNRSSTVQPEKWGSGTGDGGEPHRERKWKENRQGGCKCQWITPSSSVNLGTLCVGMADAASSSAQQVTSTCLSSSTPLLGHLFSLPPCTSRFPAFMLTHYGHC